MYVYLHSLMQGYNRETQTVPQAGHLLPVRVTVTKMAMITSLKITVNQEMVLKMNLLCATCSRISMRIKHLLYQIKRFNH